MINSLWQIPIQFGDKQFLIPNLPVVYSQIHWHCSHGTKHLGMMFSSLIYSYSIKTILEIGIANGFTTQLLIRGLEASGGGKLISCDSDAQAISLCKNFTNGSSVKHITVIADSTKTDFTQYADSIDMCVIDGDHSYEATKADIITGINLGARIITIHDYAGGQPGVVQAGEEMLKDWNKIILPERADTGDYATAIYQRPQ